MKKIIPISLILLILDQIVKLIVISNIKINTSIEIITNFFSLTYVKNDGAAFSIFRGNTLLLIIISVLTLFFLFKFLKKKNNFQKIEILAYVLLIPGIIGNLIDRIFRNGVIDYLDFNIFGYNFPIFNIADIFIVIACLILIFLFGGEQIDGNKSNR